MSAFADRRATRVVALALVACAAPPAPPAAPSPAAPFAAVVDAHAATPDGAPVAGVPTFHSLGAALAAAPTVPHDAPWRVLVRRGHYDEKLTVDRPNVTLVGESEYGVVVTHADVADTPGPDGHPLGTRGSWTMRIAAPDFRAESLTVENAFDYPANAAKPDSDPTKLHNTQAVALMTVTGSDRAAFVRVRFLGYQDTLFPNVGRHYFRDCYVAGHVDFIFGAGRAVFDHCTIVSRDRGDTVNNGYVTAPSTPATEPYGFLFVDSRLLKERPRMARNSVALGRPWHPGADPLANGSAVFIRCWMDDHIGARGWDRMSSVDSVTRIRHWYEPEGARFYEYGSTGPGAVKSPRRRVLSDSDAQYYTIANVLGDWKP